MRKYLVVIAGAVLVAVFIPFQVFAEDPVPSPAPAVAPAGAPATAPAMAPATAGTAPTGAVVKKPVKKKVRRRVKPRKPGTLAAGQAGSSTTAIAAAVKIASSPLSARLEAIERKLDQIPARTVKLAQAPYADSLAFQMQKIRVALTDYGGKHREAMASIAAGHIIRNMTWITGTGLALAGYSSVHKMENPKVNDYRLCIVGGGIIAGGQVIAGICDIVGMNKEGNAAAELQKAMENALEEVAPVPAPEPAPAAVVPVPAAAPAK